MLNVGTDDADPIATAATEKALSEADAVLMVTSSNLSGDASAMAALRSSDFIRHTLLNEQRDGRIVVCHYDDSLAGHNTAALLASQLHQQEDKERTSKSYKTIFKASTQAAKQLVTTAASQSFILSVVAARVTFVCAYPTLFASHMLSMERSNERNFSGIHEQTIRNTGELSSNSSTIYSN